MISLIPVRLPFSGALSRSIGAALASELLRTAPMSSVTTGMAGPIDRAGSSLVLARLTVACHPPSHWLGAYLARSWLTVEQDATVVLL
jgi:hypothetical protein